MTMMGMLLNSTIYSGAAHSPVVYVGGVSATRASNTAAATPTVSLSGTLTGGIAATPVAGDLVVVCQSIVSNTDLTAQTWAGAAGLVYTLADIQRVTVTSATALSLRMMYAFLGVTPDLGVKFGAFGNSTYFSSIHIMVFRGVDLTNPLDIAIVKGFTNVAFNPNHPSVLPVTDGACVVEFSGSTENGLTSSPLTSSDLSDFRNQSQGTITRTQASMGYKVVTPLAAFDAAVFGGGKTTSLTTSSSWGQIIAVLRPA